MTLGTRDHGRKAIAAVSRHHCGWQLRQRRGGRAAARVLADQAMNVRRATRQLIFVVVRSLNDASDQDRDRKCERYKSTPASAQVSARR